MWNFHILSLIIRCFGFFPHPSLPTIESTYVRRCLRKAASTIYSSYPGGALFLLLPLSRSNRSLKSDIVRFKNSYFVTTCRFLNQLTPPESYLHAELYKPPPAPPWFLVSSNYVLHYPVFLVQFFNILLLSCSFYV